MNVNRNVEGAIKNICVITIPTNSKQPEEQIAGNSRAKRMILIQLFLITISTKAIQSSTVVMCSLPVMIQVPIPFLSVM